MQSRPAAARASDGPRRSPAWRPSVVLSSALFAIALLVGVFARFDGLGTRQITTDEYYYVVGIERILETGFPVFPTGGYYVRGPLQQYLTAGLVLAFGESRLVYRLPAVLFGLAAVFATLALARRHLRPELALTVAAMLAVSSWHVEFSRFARMYAAIQLFTVVFLWALDRAWFPPRSGSRFLPHAFLVLAALSHRLSALLVPLLFLPYLLPPHSGGLRDARERLAYGAPSLGLAAGVVWFTQFDFRHLGVSNVLPDSVEPSASFLLRLSSYPFLVGGDSSVGLTIAVLVLFGAVSAVFLAGARYGRGGRRPLAWRPELLFATLFAISAATHQLVPAGAFVLVLVFRYDAHRSVRRDRALKSILAGGAIFALTWMAFALMSSEWIARVAPGDPLRAFRLTFLGFPDFFQPLVVPWREDLPWLGAMSALALAQQIWEHRKDALDRLLRQPMTFLGYFALCLALLYSAQVTTRYTFSFYPLVLIVFVLALRDLGSRIAFAKRDTAAVGTLLGSLALFAIAGDFHPKHLADVEGAEASLRIGKFARYERLWYQRIDFRSPAEFVNRSVSRVDGENLVVVAALDPVAYHLETGFIVYRPGLQRPLSRTRGTRDIWTGQPQVTTPGKLRELSQGVQRAWIIRSANPARHVFDPETAWAGRVKSLDRVFTGRDGRIEVLRVELRPVSRAPPDPT